MTESSLRLVGLTEFRNASHNSEYCLWDSFGNSIGNSDIAPYQTKYIRIKKDNFDYIKEGYIICWIDKKRYATNKKILVPSAGVEYDVYLLTTLPFLSTKNLVKFHLILVGLSLTGSCDFRYVYNKSSVK